MMNTLVSAAVWVVLNTLIVLGALWLWNRRGDRSARQAQRLILLTSLVMIFLGLLPLYDHAVLLQRAFLFAFTLGLVGAVFGVVLDVRERMEARRQRREALLRGYPTVPTYVGGWGAFWIGVATYFIGGLVLLAAAFALSWVSAVAAVADGSPERWHSLTPDNLITLACVALVISIVVGVAVWARGVVRKRYWADLTAGIEYREAVAAARAVQQLRGEAVR